MNYDLEHIKELMGTLFTLDDSAVVQDVFMKLDSSTAKKLAKVLRSRKVTREEQDLFFHKISINKNSLSVFTKGQSSLVQDGNRYIMSTNPCNPQRFKGMMQAPVRGADGIYYALSIEIGNIDFNIGDKAPIIYDDVAVFENVSAMIYPYGNYRANVLQD